MIDGRTAGGPWRASPAAALLAALTLVAGAAHLAVAVPHFADSMWVGAGLLLVGWSQLGAGCTLLAGHGWSRRAVLGVAALNLSAGMVWVVSRTVGLPIGHPGPEPVAVAGLVVVLLEVAAVAAAARVAIAGRSARSQATLQPITLVVTVLAAVGAASIAIASLPAHVSHASHRAGGGEQLGEGGSGNEPGANANTRTGDPRRDNRRAREIVSQPPSADLPGSHRASPADSGHGYEEDGHHHGPRGGHHENG